MKNKISSISKTARTKKVKVTPSFKKITGGTKPLAFYCTFPREMRQAKLHLLAKKNSQKPEFCKLEKMVSKFSQLRHTGKLIWKYTGGAVMLSCNHAVRVSVLTTKPKINADKRKVGLSHG
ncbi:hypothetical protein [Pygmaiobacter massiliensis]|uniref:hypothetical protein n=1 Tax=Pygmaiobacter massiliensis TaxID=1917873 RepID=UPI0015E0C84E|nr:hypothetical protein [Pygmaiobacter massiliensis]